MRSKYIVYSSYLSFRAPTECRYAILEAQNQDEAIRIMKHTPFISRQWEDVKVLAYSPEKEKQMSHSGKNITDDVFSYLSQFPMKNA